MSRIQHVAPEAREFTCGGSRVTMIPTSVLKVTIPGTVVARSRERAVIFVCTQPGRGRERNKPGRTARRVGRGSGGVNSSAQQLKREIFRAGVDVEMEVESPSRGGGTATARRVSVLGTFPALGERSTCQTTHRESPLLTWMPRPGVRATLCALHKGG